ncbi:hypothetical protein C8J56DRAFT_1046487 [Mycena floridula]|nr:hypothetical protein C8J56DRAFT_1046487 [Mycena floridula]
MEYEFAGTNYIPYEKVDCTANSKVVQGQPEFFQSAAPNEPEVPATLIACACTANVAKAPFADALLGAQFQAFMALLETLQEKKAKVYHGIMHTLCYCFIGFNLSISTPS